jgi:inositol phosphorylceramide synthase catalytic subunit
VIGALRRFRDHARELWPRGPLLPVLPFAAYALYSAARHDLRVEHLLIVCAVALLAYIGPRTKELLMGLYAFGLVGLLFDGMRPFQNLGLSEQRVLSCDLREVEARLFGWSEGGERFTLHDYFYVNHAPALDLVAAVPYATFILWCVAVSVFLYVRDRPAMRRFAWGFLLMNVAAFVTYHVVPAAPPWYIHQHGCAVDLSTRASEGPALARVDAMLGVPYFRGMYGKAASVFGALPSLHCAYPILVVIEGWRAFGPTMRAASITYAVAMVFSAVYLDHHWVLDALLGGAYAVGAAFVTRAVAAAFARESAAAAASEDDGEGEPASALASRRR